MEEILTQEDNQSQLQSWWETADVPAKELYHLKGDGTLILKPIGTYKERIIASLAIDSANMTLKALISKFPDVAIKFDELIQEWESTEDKLKFIGKVERIKEYLQHTNAVGDFNSLFTKLSEIEKTIAGKTEENYQLRLKLVQDAELLANKSEWKETTQKFKNIIEQWKQIGHTEKNKNDELWTRLETAKTAFFDRKRANQEDQAQEMLQNLDLKMELVEKAEKYAASDNWKEATEAFRNLMEQWKKIGRTTHERNEELWNKFITAKNIFFDRKKQHFDNIQQEQEANYAKKLELVDKAESMKDSTEWNITSQAYTELTEQWKKTGRVPGEKAEEILNRFSTAKDQFYNARKQYFETVKVSQEDNLAQKLALLKRAESLQSSTYWKDATIEMNELMDEWKKIGPVPREQSKIIWDRFLTARKYFYERKDANREQRKQKIERQVSDRLHQLQNFIKELNHEIKDEKERLFDFTEGLNDITPGHKAEELKQHLTKLIAQTEQKITHKEAKLEEVQKQLEEFESKGKEKDPAKEA